jgi:opacity protein-like surface antigen
MKPTIRRTILAGPRSATAATIAIFTAIFFAFSTAPNARAAGNIFEHIAQPGDPYNWSGFYMGFNTGGTWNHFDIGGRMSEVNLEAQFSEIPGFGDSNGPIFATFDLPGRSDTDSQPIGGGQMGFNLQFGHFVVGGEGGFSGDHTSQSSKSEQFQEGFLFSGGVGGNTQQPSGIFFETNFSSIRTAEMFWNGFIGGHVGFCWNRFLFYGSGGAAFTDIHFHAMEKADTSFFQEGGLGPATPAGPTSVQPRQVDQGLFLGEVTNKKTSSHSDVLTGWYGGGGTDYALTNTVSIGVEYRHIDWGDRTDQFMSGGPVFPGSTNVGVSGDQVMFKVNIMLWHFSP